MSVVISPRNCYIPLVYTANFNACFLFSLNLLLCLQKIVSTDWNNVCAWTCTVADHMRGAGEFSLLVPDGAVPGGSSVPVNSHVV